MYFNSLLCPRCNEVNSYCRPNFQQNMSRINDFKTSVKCDLQSKIIPHYVLQAGEEEYGDKQEVNTLEHQPLIQTMDEHPGELVENPTTMENLSDHLYSPDVQLDQFLSRPVMIKSYTWSESGNIDQSFYPWYEYLNTAIIKNKLQNYYYGSMTLHLKVIINASPFYYGAALMSYQPVPNIAGGAIAASAGTDLLNNALSQRPHVWLYPHCSQGGSMELPFIYMYDAVDLTSASSVQNLGQIRIKSYTTLENANSVVGVGATIRVYAHATNVRLGGPTVKAALQSGVISGPATAVANISKMMENVPVIGKFAKATTIGAKAVSGVASLFGFTDVPVIRDVEPLKNLPFHSLTSAHIGEPVTKLALDPKNEVSIDPSITGVHVDDELAIAKFVDRYAVTGIATWTASAAPDALLWCARVTPDSNNFETASVPGTFRVQHTPSAQVSKLFTYWRGSIVYKITAIASKFHRGRYVITWDPTGDISAAQSYVGSCFTKVVDISEETEVEVVIPYLQPNPFCRTIDSLPTTQGSSYLSNYGGETNGILTIRVFTQQTSPVATADIQLIVSTKGGKDLEFSLPRSIRTSFTPFVFQSAEMSMNSRASMNITNVDPKMDAERYLISFGESIKSLRTLLRRATLCYSDVIPYSSTAADTIVNYIAIRPCYPVSPGYDPNGFGLAYKHGTSIAAPYNWCVYSPIDWISQCFVGRRGSIIHHINLNAGKTAMGYMSASYSVTGRASNLWSGNNTSNTTSSVNQATKNALTVLDNGASGTDMTTGFAMPAISVMIPHNTPSKFMSTNPSSTMLGLTQDYTNIMTLKYIATTRDAAMTQLVDYIEIGTDYSVFFFLNVPTLYYSSNVITPVP